MKDSVLQWLLNGDPAIRWQTMRGLKGSAGRTVRREQQRVATEGWGAQLLKLQDADGRWAGGDYTPKWTSTTYTPVSYTHLDVYKRQAHGRAADFERV